MLLQHPAAELAPHVGLTDTLEHLDAGALQDCNPLAVDAGCGSRMPITTRPMPRSAIDREQAGVRPWKEQGSRVE
jgi:hypothetical protein